MKPLPFLIPKFSHQSIHLQVDEQPYLYDYLHQHPEIQISLILKGEGQLIAGGYLSRFKAGDIYVIGSNVPHVFKNDPEYYQRNSGLFAHALSIYFNWDTFGAVFWNLPEMKQLYEKRLLLDRCLKVEAPFHSKVQEMILRMWEVVGPGRLFQLFQILEFLFSMTPLHYLTTPIEIKLNQQQGERLNKIYHFTMENYQRPIQLKEVADISYLTVPSFCRYFKKSTRKSYFEFLNEVRVGHACRLLIKDKDQPIYHIAYSVGFKNLANFNRQFKKIMGLRPSDYRANRG